MEVISSEIGVVTDPPALKTVKDLSEFFWTYFQVITAYQCTTLTHEAKEVKPDINLLD